MEALSLSLSENKSKRNLRLWRSARKLQNERKEQPSHLLPKSHRPVQLLPLFLLALGLSWGWRCPPFEATRRLVYLHLICMAGLAFLNVCICLVILVSHFLWGLQGIPGSRSLDHEAAMPMHHGPPKPSGPWLPRRQRDGKTPHRGGRVGLACHLRSQHSSCDATPHTG